MNEDIDDFFQNRESALAGTITSIDGNPDDAARALQLSRETGVPPLVVEQDLENFDRQVKGDLASTIIRDNPALQEYVQSNPMAPRVSNDDWSNLDSITRRIAGLSSSVQGTLNRTSHAFIEGVTEGGGLGSWLTNTPEKLEFVEKMPEWQRPWFLAGWTALGMPIEAISRVAGGMTKAAGPFVEGVTTNLSGDPDLGRRLGREAQGFVEYTFNRPLGAHAVYGGAGAHLQMNAQLRQIADSAGPYLRANVEPPIGINEIIDKAKQEQTKIDMDELDALTRDVQQSTTRERSPELFQEMIARQTDANIYIPFDAIVKMYGDKPIKPDDAILGWVPDIQAQTRTMSLTGGDIVVPLSHWLAHVDPKVAKDLHDNIRVRRGGFTVEEVKEHFDGMAELKKFREELEAQAAEREGRPRKEMADIDVYHGSPHSFDAFSMEKIGTGEGAQSYGHGLYFAENRLVAESYALTVEPGSAAAGIGQQGGNMYRARIRANPEAMLDWDKPLNEQSPSVQAALRSVIKNEFDWTKTGGDFIQAQGRGQQAQALVSPILNKAGIPGIRYLDQGSRQLLNYEGANKADLASIETQQAMIEQSYKHLSQVDEGTDVFNRIGRNILDAELRIKELQDNIDFRQGQLDKGGSYNYVLFDDSLVEILDRNGEAINAVRRHAGLEPLAMAEEAKTKGPRTPLEGEEVRHYGRYTTAYVLPYEKWHSIEKIIDAEVDKLLNRIAPTVERQGAQDLEMKGHTSVSGAYLAYNDRAPIILWSLGAKDPFAVARHEAIHFLRDNDFFTAAEWDILKNAAEKEGWLAKYQIEKTYTEASTHRSGPELRELQLEEAIAEEYATWAKNPENVKGALRQVFEKLHMLLVEIKEAIAKALGYEPKPEELFQMVESGEIGSRYGQPEIDRGETVAASAKPPVQGELDVTRQEDKAIFQKAGAIGMTVPQYQRYLKLIEKRNLEDIQAQRERAIAFEKKRQTAEWRQESEALEDEVRTDLRNRPDIATADFFRYGELYGEKLDGRKPQLNEAMLTTEEKAMLPAQWFGPNGLLPDDAAGLFGFTSGKELIAKLAEFEGARGNIRPGEFLHRMVKAETERRMVEKYGELDQNILAAAEDHVLGSTQMDLLHEETIALGMRSGAEISFTKEDVQAWAATRFAESPIKGLSTVRFLDEAGKAGRAAELALLKGDFAEAFKQKQRQYLSVLMAKEAKQFEKQVDRFEKLATRFSRREVTGFDHAFTDQIQSLLQQAEYPVRRTPAELQEAITRRGYTGIDDFTQSQINDGWELAVQPWIREGQLRQRAGKMNVEEMRDFMNSITSLSHVGREINKLEVAGAKQDFEAFKENVIRNIRSLDRQPKSRGAFKRLLYGLDSELVRMEEVVKDLDLRQELGPMFDVLIRPMAEAKHTEFSMLEELAKRFRGMRGGSKEWQRTLDDTIPQQFFKDPDGTLFDLTRENMIGIMVHFGNKSNAEKFVKGWAAANDTDPVMFERQLRTMFDQHAKKEDWEFVQNLWDVFEMWRPQANEMYYQLSGVPPKWIDAVPIDTPHGQFRGGYFPLIRDKYWAVDPTPGANIGLFNNYHRATPTNHYTKSRTGAIYPVEFQESLDQVASRMQQEIHDISYRRALISAKKVIDDKSIKNAIVQHYGQEYADQMPIWLQKIASHFSIDEQANSTMNTILRRFRYNLVMATLPLNLNVILSPDVGSVPLKGTQTAFINAFRNDGETKALAMAKSKEIPHTFRNMDRDFREQLDNMVNSGKIAAAQAEATRMFFKPALTLSQQFRMTTFAVEYNKRIAQGLSEGEAATIADSIVREKHGAAGIADLPAAMTGSEALKTFTVFMGYFNTMYNWQRQLPGQAKRGEASKFIQTMWGSVIIGSLFGAALFNQQKEGDPWWKVMAKAVALQPLSTIPFVRDAAQYFSEGFNSRTPLASVIKSVGDAYNDVIKAGTGKKVDKPIRHGANVVGLTLGVPGATQIGRTGQFAADVNRGKQRPRNFTEWWRGIRTGEARLKK